MPMNKFKEYSIKEFNEKFNVSINEDMNIEELTEYLEENEIGYLYASHDHRDIVREAEILKEETEHECDLIFVNNVYLALL